jgi:serine protease Do
LVRAAGAARALSVKLWRQGEKREVSMALAAEPQESEKTPALALGLQLRELPAAQAKSIGLAFGLMVTKVGAPADRSRVLPGDVIVAVDQTPISSLEDFNRLVGSHTGAIVGLLIRRAESDHFIALDVGGNSSSGASRAPEDPNRTPRRSTDTPLRT